MKTTYSRDDFGDRQHVHITRGIVCRAAGRGNWLGIRIFELVRHPAARPFLDDDRFDVDVFHVIPKRLNLVEGDEVEGLSFDGFGMQQVTKFVDRDGRLFEIPNAI